MGYFLSFGRITLSMTWITPLLAAMSVLTTCAASTVTFPPRNRDHVATDGLCRLELHDVGGHHFAGDHVVSENPLQLRLVGRLQELLERAGR